MSHVNTAKSRKYDSSVKPIGGYGDNVCLPNDETNKARTYRLKATKEIITSERNYLEQLEMLMKYFIQPLKVQAIIDDHSHTFLFGQIEMIYNLNGELLRVLEQNMDKVAQAFLKMAPFLKLYSVYAFDFRNALLIIQEITEKNPIFRKFLEQTEMHPEVQRTLNSLMIVPIQRLPRYKLLLEQVLLYTSPSENDFKCLKGGYGDNVCLPNDETNKARTYRLKATKEIITSERNYLEQLEMLMKYFIQPLKVQAIIDDHSHTFLFGQIEMIYNLNGELLRVLEQNMDKVAQAFLKMAPFLKLYSVYAFDFRNALLIIQEITEKNPIFRKFLEQTEMHPEVQRTLNSLMIVPIQRLPRYKLLLEQVLLYTSPSENDFKCLKESVKQIESIVSHINLCVEEQEVTISLLNLQNSMVYRSPNIVKPSRRIILEGSLKKVARSGAHIKRYCVLMTDIFIYCKTLKERPINSVVKNALECCCIFPLKKCKVYELFPDSFKITCQADGIILSSSDLHLVNTWKNCIRDAIDMHIKCRKTLRKESSKRKPTRKKDNKYFDNYYVNDLNRGMGHNTMFLKKRFKTHSGDDDEHEATSSCFPCKKIDSALNFLVSDSSYLHTDKNDIQKIKYLKHGTHSEKNQTHGEHSSILVDPFFESNNRSLKAEVEVSYELNLNEFSKSNSKLVRDHQNSLENRYNPKYILSSGETKKKKNLPFVPVSNVIHNLNAEKASTPFSVYSHEKENNDAYLPPLRKRVKFDFKECLVDNKNETASLNTKVSLAERLYRFFENFF